MSLLAGAAILGGTSLLGSALGGLSQRKNTKTSIQEQRAENQKTREYNLMLAKQQNAWNLEQWHRENEYNDPQQQMNRLRKAGLNPNLAYENGLDNTAASSPEQTAGESADPTDMSALANLPTIGSMLRNSASMTLSGIQSLQGLQQAQKTGAEAKGQETLNEGYKIDNEQKQLDKLKTQEEITNLQITNDYEDVLKQQAVQLNDVIFNFKKAGIELTRNQSKLAFQQAEKIDAEINQINTNIKLLDTKVKNIDMDTALKKLESDFKRPYMQSLIKNLESSTGLNSRKIQESLEQYQIDLMLSESKDQQQKATANLFTQLGVKAQYQAGKERIEFQDLDKNKGFYNGMKKVNAVTSAVKDVTGIAADVTSVVTKVPIGGRK